MNNKCLLTRLRGAVSNSDLPIFGEFKTVITRQRFNTNEFNINSHTDRLHLLNPDVPVIYSLSNGAVFVTNNTDIVGESQITLTPDNTKSYGIYNPNGYTVLTISDKYNASVIIGDEPFTSYDDISFLEYCNPKYFKLPISGNIKVMENWKACENIRLDLYGLKQNGNLCLLPSGVMYCYNCDTLYGFEWSSGKKNNSNSCALALNSFALTPSEIDRYFIDTANCAWGATDSRNRNNDYKKINIASTTGSYTPESIEVKLAINNLYSSMYPNLGDTGRVNGTYFTSIKVSGIEMSNLITI